MTGIQFPKPDASIIARREAIIEGLKPLVAPKSLITTEDERRAFETDALTAYRRMPLAVVLPRSTEELSAVMAYLHREGVNVVARGAGTSLAGGAIPQEDAVVIGVAKMARILDIDYANRTIRVQSGVTNLSISNAVMAERFFYAPDPSSQLACTIAGNIGMNSGGAHCLKYGVTTNNVLGVKMVLVDGTIVEIGGPYLDSGGLDLLGLVVGSEGQLGIVTEATLRIFIADWAVKNGIKKVATLTSDYAPGNDALNFFKEHFTAGGGEIVEEVKVPLANPDFAPFLQRMKDAKPDAMFVFVPAGQGGNFMKQYAERGLDKSGIKVIGPGDVMDDDLLNGMGDAALGTVTAHIYSAAHPSALNKEFVAAYKKAFGSRPGFMAVSGYDGMHLIYEALKKTGGKTDGDALVGAMKGMKWESPRGPISIDPETRDIVQNVYIRKVEKVDGELYNVEFQTFDAVKDPGKTKK